MNEILLYGYEFLSALLPFGMLFAVLRVIQHWRGQKCSAAACVLAVLFAVYISGVYHFTEAGTLQNWLQFGLHFDENEINLIPFSRGVHLIDYALNIVLFIPLGALVPMLWKRMRKWYYAAGSGFAFSLFIEITQLMNHRKSDVDDLILNTAGALIGYGLYLIWNRCVKKKDRFCGMAQWELPVMVLFLYGARFFLYNEMSFAKMLYGF